MLRNMRTLRICQIDLNLNLGDCKAGMYKKNRSLRAAPSLSFVHPQSATGAMETLDFRLMDHFSFRAENSTLSHDATALILDRYNGNAPELIYFRGSFIFL